MYMCSVPIATPSWFSTRKRLEQKLPDLHKCTDLNQVKQLHAQILKSNLHLDLHVVPKLIVAYSLCCQMPLAINAFNQIHRPNVYLYDALIRAHALNSQPLEAFVTFFTMQSDEVNPSNFTFVFLLKSCSGQLWFPVLETVHAQILKFGFMSNVFVSNSLIGSYSKCGSRGITAAKKLFVSMGDCRDILSWNLMIAGFAKAGLFEEARKVFDEMPQRDIICWNTMLDAYIKAGDMNDAINLFEKMPERNIISWNTMLNAYVKARKMDDAFKLFEKMPERDIITWNTMLDAYVKVGEIDAAFKLFEKMPERDAISWKSMLVAYVEAGELDNAFKLFEKMPEKNIVCWNTMLDAYVKAGEIDDAFKLFEKMPERNIVSWNTVLDAYVKAGGMDDALKLFEEMPERNIVSWNTILNAYVKAGEMGDAFKLFERMPERDIVSWNTMLDAYVKVGETDDAFKVFEKMPERDIISWNTILDAYVKAGEMDNAFKLFEKMPERDVVSWSTMLVGYCKAGDMVMAQILFDKMPVKNSVSWTQIITGFVENGLTKEAIGLYDQMEEARVKLDDAHLTNILIACADYCLLELGEKVHASIKKNNLKCTTEISNVLVDMYAKCGRLDVAYNVFNGIRDKDIESWNTMLEGLIMHGHEDPALELFERMKEKGFSPNKLTMLGVLCACRNAGLIDDCIQYFSTMEREYGIVPEVEHYDCMIDVLSRMGRLEEAIKLIRTMPMEPNATIWAPL